MTEWRRSPRRFVTEVFDPAPTLEAWQGQALDLVGEHDRVAIRSGHGVGKTTLVAWIVLWFLLTRFPTRVPVTANSQDQLRDVVWPALLKWHRALKEPLRSWLIPSATHLHLASAPEDAFAVARTASRDNPEALQGFHAEHVLFAIEEASGIHDIVFEVAQGALSTAGAKVLMVSNPTRLTGYFHDAFTRPGFAERWAKMHVNSEDVPRARGHIDDIVARYGLESNAYRVRVKGDFPTSDSQQVIPSDWIEAAVGRDVKPTRFRPVWGLDVARFGDDRTALARRRGNTLIEPVKWWRGKDTMQVAGLVMDAWKLADEIDRPSEILVDVIGIGAGVVDRLFELGLPVRGVNVGESPAVSDRHMRLRDELWFKTRAWFEAKDCTMPRDEALIAELAAPTYDFSSSGKIVIESKADMKSRGLPSPDLADAFMLTFAGGLDRPREERHRYRRAHSQPSGWAA